MTQARRKKHNAASRYYFKHRFDKLFKFYEWAASWGTFRPMDECTENMIIERLKKQGVPR
jgi:hypothetical protein